MSRRRSNTANNWWLQDRANGRFVDKNKVAMEHAIEEQAKYEAYAKDLILELVAVFSLNEAVLEIVQEKTASRETFDRLIFIWDYGMI